MSSLGAAFGGTVTVSGIFPGDDYIQELQYTVQQTGQITVWTTSFASAVLNGFEPLLALYDGSTGLQLTAVDCANFPTPDCANSTPDALGRQWDAYLIFPGVAGITYHLLLTQYDNYAPTGLITDPSSEQGAGNFTAEPPFNNHVPNGKFLLNGLYAGEPRTGKWEINFAADDAVGLNVAPEPSTGVLLLGGLAAAVWFRKSRKSSKEQLQIGAGLAPATETK